MLSTQEMFLFKLGNYQEFIEVLVYCTGTLLGACTYISAYTYALNNGVLLIRNQFLYRIIIIIIFYYVHTCVLNNVPVRYSNSNYNYTVSSLFFTLEMGDIFCSIGVYERQKSASIAFTNFGTAHKYGANPCNNNNPINHTLYHL